MTEPSGSQLPEIQVEVEKFPSGQTAVLVNHGDRQALTLSVSEMAALGATLVTLAQRVGVTGGAGT